MSCGISRFGSKMPVICGIVEIRIFVAPEKQMEGEWKENRGVRVGRKKDGSSVKCRKVLLEIPFLEFKRYSDLSAVEGIVWRGKRGVGRRIYTWS